MSERFSDIMFLISPLLDARFKLLRLNNFPVHVKARVLEKIRNAFVHFCTKLKLQLSKDMVTGASTSKGYDYLPI